MAKTPVSEQVQVNFRIPAPLRDRLKAMAETNNRSMNAEIVARLEASFIKSIKTDDNQWSNLLKEISNISNSNPNFIENADSITLEIKINKYGNDD